MRYFKTQIPKTRLMLSNGSWFEFEKLSDQVGVHQTENPQLISEFEAAIRGERAGVTEISKEEYFDLKKKQKLGELPKIFREEVSVRQSKTMSSSKEAAAKRAEGDPTLVKMEAVKVPAPHHNKPPTEVFRPQARKAA